MTHIHATVKHPLKFTDLKPYSQHSQQLPAFCTPRTCKRSPRPRLPRDSRIARPEDGHRRVVDSLVVPVVQQLRGRGGLDGLRQRVEPRGARRLTQLLGPPSELTSSIYERVN